MACEVSPSSSNINNNNDIKEISPTAGSNPKLLEQRLANLEENYLHCVICFEQYEDPRILDCVHSFCLRCIKQHVKNSRTIKCPICNQEMRTPKLGIEDLKVNFFIKNLIDEFSCMSIKETTGASEKVCNSCTTGNAATAYCKDCCCNICFICEDQHARLKIWQGHVVEPIPKKDIDDKEKHKLIKKAQKNTTQIDKNMKGIARVLEHKVSFLHSRINAIEQNRNKTMAKLDESHDKFTRIMKKYIDDLKDEVAANANERLGNMKDVYTIYEEKLNNFILLKKQRDVLDDVNIKDHATLSQELLNQLEEFVKEFPDLPSEVVPSDVKETKFVESKKGSGEYDACAVEFIGFLKPIANRKSRKVSMFTKEMSDSMIDYAIECAHDVLDELGENPRRVRMYNNIAERIVDAFLKRYERGDWACVITPEGGWGMNLSYRRLVAFNLCGMDIFLFDTNTGK